MSLQAEIIAKLGVKQVIDVDADIRMRVDFLKEHVLGARATGLLIAVSGGIDSAVAAGLCKRATDELTAEQGKPYKTLALFQPYSEQSDISDSYATAEALNLDYRAETNIGEAVDELTLEAEYALKSLGVHRHLSVGGKGNVKARTRMVVQYAMAFELNMLVVGTEHASEALTGFFTKWGDGAVDLNPMGSLNKRQVKQVAERLGVPQAVLDKVPTAGLWEGQTDELEMGVSYADNCDYLEGKTIASEAQAKLEALYMRTAHKRNAVPRI